MYFLKRMLKRLTTQFRPTTDQPPPGIEHKLAALKKIAQSDSTFAESLLKMAITTVDVNRPESIKLLATIMGDKLIVSTLRALSSDNNSLVYAHRIFAEVEFLVRKHGTRPDAVLEIGPGTNLGSLFCFVASGVQTAVGVDIQPMEDPGPTFYRDLQDYITCVEGFSWWRYFATVRAYPEVSFPSCAERSSYEEIFANIDYQSPVSSDDLLFPDGSFDLVYSAAALEHVSNPAETVTEISRVLRPGGLAVHGIGVNDHGEGKLLDFLTLSDAEYQAKTQPYGEGRSLGRILDGSWTGDVFCNRLRMSDWVELFDRQGFETLELEPTVTLGREYVNKERFAEPFRSKSEDDLAVLAFRIIARKRES